MNARLDQMVAAMNAATGEQNRIEAIVAAMNEMASQRKEMFNHMMSMRGKMMSGQRMGPMMGGPGMWP